MTTTTAHDLPTPIAHDPATLPPGMLACPGCGIGTPAPSDPAEVVTVHRAADTPAQRRDAAPTRLVRCLECCSVRARAAALLDAHPCILARLGSIAAEHAEAALGALVVLALALPDPETATEAEVSALLNRLAVPGSVTRWQSRRPAPGQSQASAWAHVTEDDRASLRAAYAAMLRDRLARHAPPEGITPPPLDPFDRGGALALTGACLLCGVGSVVVPAAWLNRPGGREAVALDVWLPLLTSPGSLGGMAGPESVAGYACASCAVALADAGGVGPRARERALLDHLRAEGRTEAADQLRAAFSGDFPPRLPGWGALAYAAHRRSVPAPPANREPWAHLDLLEVTA